MDIDFLSQFNYEIVLFFLLLWSCWSDLRDRLIPNIVSVLVLVLGIFFHMEFLFDHLLSFLFGCVLGGILYGFKIIGGGDYKLLAALSFGFLMPEVIWFWAYVLICGGLIGAYYQIVRQEKTFPYAGAIFFGWGLSFV